MKLSVANNLTFGCLLALALKQFDRSCRIVKIALSEKNGALVYFTCRKLISSDNFNELSSTINQLLHEKPTIKVLGECSLKDLAKNADLRDLPVEKLFSISQAWQKVEVGNEILITTKEAVAVHANAIKAFDLEAVGGAESGEEEVVSLRVISGVGFASSAEKKVYENYCEELKQRDHRRLGKQLGIFTFNDLVGKGLPIWLPNGGLIKALVNDCVNNLWRKYDFQFVSTPVLGTLDLYKKSGHWTHYREYMFPPIDTGGEQFVLRPMTCPHHCLIYQNFPQTEKDLPLRLSEHSLLSRYEASGGLMGLERVRMMTLPDVHIFCRPDQVMDEIQNCYSMIKEAMELFGFSFNRIDLSLHDPNDHEKYVNNPELWKTCEEQLRTAMRQLKIEFTEKIGEAAFYGPKIDFQVENYANKLITVSTIQLDFNLPNFFELKYTERNGTEKVPVIIHFGMMGTFERFIAILLEQTKGVFPFWLAIKQVRLIPVSVEKHLAACKKIVSILKENHLRVDLDDSAERLGKKIRNAQVAKVPFQVVIGDSELKDNLTKISYREYGAKDLTTMEFDQFLSMLVKKNNVFRW